MNEFSRAELLLGIDGVEHLKKSTVMIVGVGGVGSYSAEALARCGIGKIVLVDKSALSHEDILTNINAFYSNVGTLKVDATKARIIDINKLCEVVTTADDNYGDIDFSGVDYIIDTLDNLDEKLSLIENAKKSDVKIISCIQLNDKSDITALNVADLSKIKSDEMKNFAKSLRLKGVKKLKTVFSTEAVSEENSLLNSFVTSSAGLIVAGEVIKALCGEIQDI